MVEDFGNFIHEIGRGGGRPKILVWQAIVNLSNIGMADCGR